jgi:hypothetical protein
MTIAYLVSESLPWTIISGTIGCLLSAVLLVRNDWRQKIDTKNKLAEGLRSMERLNESLRRTIQIYADLSHRRELTAKATKSEREPWGFEPAISEFDHVEQQIGELNDAFRHVPRDMKRDENYLDLIAAIERGKQSAHEFSVVLHDLGRSVSNFQTRTKTET